MKQILIFSGTTEGRSLAEYLCRRGLRCTVCVATEYGEQVMNKLEDLTVRQGRMTGEEMKLYIEEGDFLGVVDATHPFATVVSDNIVESMKDSHLPYFRLKRDTNNGLKEGENIQFFEDNETCAAALEGLEGNILLTTGSKELAVYSRSDKLRPRLYVRVLPGLESITLCHENGITGKQILAMQGPFSVELNEAIIRQYDIRCMVTKESGNNGGFLEKMQAAQNTGIKAMVIGNPEKKEGYTFREVCNELEKLTGIKLEQECNMDISLVGMGMGAPALLTIEAKEQIKEAGIIFGAERLLEGIPSNVEKLPYYMAKDIIPNLIVRSPKHGYHEKLKVAILFSGDTGFYSGAGKLYEELQNEIKAGKLTGEVRIYPGISCVSYLAAKLGCSWQDSEILSIHGRAANILEAVKTNERTFLLVSGLEDMKALGSMLMKAGMEEVKVSVGYQLSYPEEQIMILSPADCLTLEAEGLYVCLLENYNWKNRILTHGLSDEAFLRDKVPMTKEEIREISICKLQLYGDGVLYDIGSGTGSIAVECARLSECLQVYAIDKKREAVCLTKENRSQFNLNNITVIEGEAPEAFNGLPAPTHAFLGGSSGNMKGILEKLYEINPRLRVVINAITLETISEVTALLSVLPIENQEIVQVQVSRAKTLGRYHLLQGENPVYIISFDFKVYREGVEG
ncbi:precorrin-6A reductase [Anaerocolumna sp.]|uniref:precorrin-6A reductase n=1 Tax=Anaerocolumna sp. TaxID=2041569 RepID=UPI0028AF639E|nr:precorrin-6A reductase [Anaerocolumna sp.]